MPGPIPKRSEVRRRKSPEGEPDKAPAAEKVVRPRAKRDWHPIAAGWFRALGESGQSRFYEPSDWAHALLVAEGMSRMLMADRMSAQMFASIDSASTRLMVTEGDRRRMRLELERETPADADDDAAVVEMAAWRERLGG